MTDLTEHMLMMADADGGDQIVDDGGVVWPFWYKKPPRRRLFDKDEILPNHENSENSVIKYVTQWVKDSISLVAKMWTRKSDHKKNMMSNAIDGDIGHFDNKIDMIGMKS